MYLSNLVDKIIVWCYNADMGTRYEAGRRFEQRVRNYFKKKGYQAIRSAGSKTAADLVIFDQNSILLVQCTTNEACKDENDRNKLLAMNVNPGMIPVMVWKDGYRGPLVFERLDGGPVFWEDDDEV